MAKYIKAGYDNALDFDPASGVIKYGNYEFFADQLGIKPTAQSFSFDKYKASYSNLAGISIGPNNPATDERIRSDFERDVANGVLSENPNKNPMYPADYVRAQDTYSSSTGPINSAIRTLTATPDGYDVSTYDIPTNIDFVNKLNAEAVNLNANAKLGQETDASRPTPGNARLGKPNYSRAGTILAGQQSPLGGASTTLGS